MRNQNFSVSLFMRQQSPPAHGSQSLFYGWALRQLLTLPEREEMDKTKISATAAEYMALLWWGQLLVVQNLIYVKISFLLQRFPSGQGALGDFWKKVESLSPNSQSSVKDKDFVLLCCA